MTILSRTFFIRDDVVQIAQELLGKWLLTESSPGLKTGGMIIETEAYAGPHDRACHAYNMRRTKRTEIMFHKGGVAYVYLCYGLHTMLNIVTNVEGTPHAVLIRGLYPTEGIDTMLKRRDKNRLAKDSLTSGPGMVAQALGISSEHNGIELGSSSLWIEDRGVDVQHDEILAGPRIGVDYAGEDALLPWRFLLKKRNRSI